ncbi:MAG: hypothetical protein MRZ47_07240 [Lachnospiraceae bacterium]|nr:hypothetical protein [Lachnospiraceae bacterium]
MAKAQRVLGIEIGYSLTQVVEMDYQSKHPQVYGVFSMKTPEGIFNDGLINPTEEYVNDLKATIAANGMNAKKVIFAVSSTKIANREAVIPFVKEKQIRELLMTNITDYFPVDPSQYEFAYNIMETMQDDAGAKQYRIMVMAAPEDILRGYSALANSLGLDLSSIDYTGNCIFQALRTRFQKGVNLIVKIDERSSLLTVTNNGVITMQRPGIYGADQIVDIMMETDVYGDLLSYTDAVKTLRRNNLVMRPEEESLLAEKEAEVAKLEQAAAKAQADAATTGDTSMIASTTVAAKQAGANLKMLRLRRDVTISYQQLIGSIVRVIDYYNSKNRDAAIDNIIITGIAADFWGFSGLLAQELGRDVEVLKDLAGTNITQGLHLQGVSLGDYIAAIGATLTGVGFQPTILEAKSKKGSGDAKAQLASIGQNESLPYIVLGAGVVAAIVIAAICLVPYFQAKTKNDSLNERKAQLEPVRETYNAYVSTKSDYEYLQAVYDATDTNNEALVDVINELEEKLPKDSQINSFSANNSTIAMAIEVGTKEEAAGTIINLRTFKNFSDVYVDGITEYTDDETGVSGVTFAVTCTYGDNPMYADDAADEAAAEETAE